jgi:4-amino-4-deoxy-L-arabinose transferase-like glycosyltransferase
MGDGSMSRLTSDVSRPLRFSATDTPDESAPELARVWWVVTIGLTIVRSWLAAWVPLGDDEGYYWVWSRHPAPSYFDHPPMVAWLVALSTQVLGTSLLTIRLPFVVCGTITAIALRALVQEATGDTRLASYTTLLFQVVPVFFALGFMVIPDTPLMLCWILAGRGVQRWERRPGASSVALLGMALGAALLSKYIAILLAASVAGYLVLRRGRRSVAPLLGASSIAFLLMIPVLWWNALHDWASFRYQFVSRHHGAHFDVARLALYLGSQVLYLSPIVCVLVAVAIVRARPRWPQRARDDELLWWLGAPTACLFLAVSGFTSFKPNWAVPGYATLVVLGLRVVAAWRARAPRAARSAVIAAAVTAFVCAALPLVQLVHPVFPLPRRADPTVDLEGWPEIAARVRETAANMRAESGAVPFIAAGNYQIASRLEFYLPGHPSVISLNTGRDAYDDWQDLRSLSGRNFVFVATDHFKTAPDRLARCDGVRIERRWVTASRPREQFRTTIYTGWGYRPESSAGILGLP